MVSPYAPHAPYPSGGARGKEVGDFHPIDAISMGWENFSNWATNAPPKNVTRAQRWINEAPSEEERARRVGHAPTVFSKEDIAATDPSVWASASSSPLPGEGTAEGMSMMPEGDVQEILKSPAPTRPTDPSAGAPPEMAPPESPEMASIRGKLGTLQQEIARQAGRQADEYKRVEDEYKKERDRIQEQTQVDNARRKMQLAEGSLNTAVEKLSTWEINPTRAFPNAFSKVAAVLGVSMGAYAQGLSGGKLPNTALQIVNSAIDRDIEAQKAEFQKLKGMVDEKRNVYGMAMRMLGDERQADELARSAAYRAFNAGVTSMSKQFGLTNQQNAQALQALGLEERENFHRAQLTRRAGEGSGELSDKMRKEFGDLQALRNQITSFRELHGKRSPLDVIGQHMGLFMATDGVQIEQKRGLIARQLLMYTDSGRISDHDYTIMMKMVPGVWQSVASGEKMLDGLSQMLDEVESARWQSLSDSQKSTIILNKAASVSQGAGLSQSHLSQGGGGGWYEGDGEKNTALYWRTERAKAKAAKAAEEAKG